MIIELTNYFNWKGSQINPGQVLTDLPDGLVQALINGGNAKLWTPSQSVTEEKTDEQTIQANESKDVPAGQGIPAGRVSATVENARTKAFAEVGQIGRGTAGRGNTTSKPATANTAIGRSGKPAGTNAGKAKAKK